MQRLFFLSLFAVSLLSYAHCESPNDLLGEYSSKEGTKSIVISENGIASENTEELFPLLFGHRSGPNRPSGIFGTYYIKPIFIKNQTHTSLVNIWLSSSDNTILAVLILDLQNQTGILSQSLWQLLTGENVRTEYIKKSLPSQ